MVIDGSRQVMTRKEILSVPDASTIHSKETIEGALGALAGVIDASVDLNAKRVTVVFEEGEVDRGNIMRVIEEVGYIAWVVGRAT
jgi:copper chaperone